jgi:TRAP-type C4-dicarboxylate transport system permease small subunit
MGRIVALALSVLMVVVGVIWTLQGLGHLEGSPMTGVQIWAVLGPAVAGFGIALAIVALRGRR